MVEMAWIGMELTCFGDGVQFKVETKLILKKNRLETEINWASNIKLGLKKYTKRFYSRKETDLTSITSLSK